MSTEINEIINIDDLIERFKRFKDIKTNRDFADLLNISPQDFSSRKKRGTLFQLIIEYCINNSYSIDAFIYDNNNININNIDDDTKSNLSYEIYNEWAFTARARKEYPFMKELVENTNKSAKNEQPVGSVIKKSMNILENALIDYQDGIKVKTKDTV